MTAYDEPDFLDYMEKFAENIQLMENLHEFRWSFASAAICNILELACLGFQVSYTIETTWRTNTSILINGYYNGKVLAVRFYNQGKFVDIASSERLPGAVKHYEDNRTYFIQVFRANDCLNASLYLEKLISKTMGQNVNLRYQ